MNMTIADEETWKECGTTLQGRRPPWGSVALYRFLPRVQPLRAYQRLLLGCHEVTQNPALLGGSLYTVVA